MMLRDRRRTRSADEIIFFIIFLLLIEILLTFTSTAESVSTNGNALCHSFSAFVEHPQDLWEKLLFPGEDTRKGEYPIRELLIA